MDIDEIRRLNMRTIETEAGGTSAAAHLVGMSPSQFANLRDGAKDSKTGRPRGMHKDTARKIELAAGKTVGWLDQDHAKSNVSPAPLGSTPIPLISSIAAGQLTEVVDPFPPGAADEWLYTDLVVSDGTFALELEGYSMTDEFQPGDRVIIDPAVQPQPGDYVAAQNGAREATFKKYRPRGLDERGNTVFELVPLNDDYPTLRSDVIPLRVIGTMIEHRKYRRKR